MQTVEAPIKEVEIIEVRPLEQWRQDLLAAADWLEANEWCQGWRGRGNTRCAAGALMEVWGLDASARVVISENTAYLQLERFVAPYLIEDYNDTPGRTKAEVIATMRACAMQP